jgi:peptide/nickel transport system ATP-binding protein
MNATSPAEPRAPILSVRDLATEFQTAHGPVRAVDGVSFDVHAGEIVGLVGESGSGKTVTGFSILGLIDPPGRIATGSIRLEGTELVGAPAAMLRTLRGRRVSMVFQDPATTLNPVLSIGTQMHLALSAHERVSRSAARDRAIAALTRVGIPDAARRLDDFPFQFSGGMRQRVAIAIAMLNRPALIVCDEPTTALDVSIQAQILAEMKTLARDSGTALIWISHDLATVSSMASRILVMYAGRLIEDGPTATVLRDPRHPYTRGLMASLPANAEPGRPLQQIPGSTPSLAALPPGCAFAPRCPVADDACAVPPAVTRDGSRGWRCHHPHRTARPVSDAEARA